MKPIYIETSAILSWLLGEPNSNGVIKALNQSGKIVSSALSIVETERALIRAEVQNLITAKEHLELKGLFARNRVSW